MSVNEQLIIRHALTVLDSVGAGLSEGALFDQVERMFGRRVTVQERAHARETMVAKEWIYDYKDPILERVLFAVTVSGRNALAAL